MQNRAMNCNDKILFYSWAEELFFAELAEKIIFLKLVWILKICSRNVLFELHLSSWTREISQQDLSV